MTFYEIRIEFDTAYNQHYNKNNPSYRQMKAIIEAAFLNAGWELTEEGVEIFNED